MRGQVKTNKFSSVHWVKLVTNDCALLMKARLFLNIYSNISVAKNWLQQNFLHCWDFRGTWVWWRFCCSFGFGRYIRLRGCQMLQCAWRGCWQEEDCKKVRAIYLISENTSSSVPLPRNHEHEVKKSRELYPIYTNLSVYELVFIFKNAHVLVFCLCVSIYFWLCIIIYFHKHSRISALCWLCISQWRTQKISEGGKVSSESCDVTNQL